VAQSTTAGRSALAVLRVSGPDACGVGQRVCEHWPHEPRRLGRSRFRDPTSGEILDDGLVAWFPSPSSYTGEDVVEIHTHGGLSAPAAVLGALIRAGAHAAVPGEFTQRALWNGKVDLVRAEAIGDLIDARTQAARRAAIHGVSGAMTARFAELRDALIGLEGLLAFDLDFPEEDAGQIARAEILAAATTVEERILAVIRTAPAATIAAHGALVVLAGVPNSGKSSLFNALIGQERAITSAVPGTTRDAIEVLVDADPWPYRLVDTAGLRDAHDAIERAGIETATRYLAGADVVIACDCAAGLASVVSSLGTQTGAVIISVRTKADVPSPPSGSADFVVSARTGDGLAALREGLLRAIASRTGGASGDDGLIMRERQRSALELAAREVAAFREAWAAGALPAPVAATHIRAAVLALDELIGTVTVDDVLARVFASFCVGK